jgi:hypothetical protein
VLGRLVVLPIFINTLSPYKAADLDRTRPSRGPRSDEERQKSDSESGAISAEIAGTPLGLLRRDLSQELAIAFGLGIVPQKSFGPANIQGLVQGILHERFACLSVDNALRFAPGELLGKS